MRTAVEDDMASRWLPHVVVAVTTLLALSPLFVVDSSLSAVVDMGSGLVLALVATVVLLPLPVAYVAYRSRDGFSRVAFATGVGVVPALSGGLVVPVAAGLFVGGLYVASRAQATMSGAGFWGAVTATGRVAAVLALMMGVFVAGTYQADAGFRGEVRERATNETTALALEQLGGLAGGDGSDGLSRQVVSRSRQLANTSILLTQRRVFEAVRADGSFSRDQVLVLEGAFQEARREVPERIGRRAEAALANRSIDGASPVRSRAARVVERFTEPTLPVLVLLALTVFSFVYVLKLPLGLLGAVYLGLLGRIGG